MINTMRLALFGSCALVFAGCANLNSIYRHNQLHSKGQVEYIDAKQRAVFAIPTHNFIPKLDKNGNVILDTKGQPKYHDAVTSYKICSEPSPDVFSAYATALAAQGSKGAASFGAQFGLSSSETAATIERTQTINLMRESLFRTCERFLNGAHENIYMSVQAARDQRMMVATLAIEQLTGVVKRSPTILNTQAQSQLTEAHSKLVDAYLKDKESMENAHATHVAAQSAAETSEKTYKEMNKPEAGKQEGYCDLLAKTPPAEPAKEPEAPITQTSPPVKTTTNKTTILDKNTGNAVEEKEVKVEETALAGPPEEAPAKRTLEQCNAAKADASVKKTQADAAKIAFDQAEKRFKETAKLLESVGTSMISTGAGGYGTGDSGTSSTIHDCDNCGKEIADAVKEITRMAFDTQSELIFICSRELNELPKGINRFNTTTTYEQRKMIDSCLKLFDAKANEMKSTAKALVKTDVEVFQDLGFREEEAHSLMAGAIRASRQRSGIENALFCLRDGTKEKALETILADNKGILFLRPTSQRLVLEQNPQLVQPIIDACKEETGDASK